MHERSYFSSAFDQNDSSSMEYKRATLTSDEAAIAAQMIRHLISALVMKFCMSRVQISLGFENSPSSLWLSPQGNNKKASNKTDVCS